MKNFKVIISLPFLIEIEALFEFYEFSLPFLYFIAEKLKIDMREGF